MRDLKDLLILLLGFIPWLLFLFLAGHSMTSLERALLISLAASLVFGFRDLRHGFILQWGSLLFFLSCFILVNILKNTWVARHMDILANSFLAGLVWLTVLVGKPFALQYARKDLPREKWNDPNFIRGCRSITVVWGALMTFSVCVSVFKRISPVSPPDWVYFDITLLTMLAGVTYTTIFKRQKRLQREKAQR